MAILGMSLPSGGSMVSIAIWLFVFILIGIVLGTIVLMVLLGKNQKKVVEVDMSTKRMRIFNGRIRTNKKSNMKQFWAGKLKKFLPQLQGDAAFLKGKNDAYILLKDKNGMHHTVIVPTYEQLKKWYKTQHSIDLDTEAGKKKLEKGVADVYFLPNPHEDLDWLSSQAIEAEKEFKVDHWWQSPTIAYLGTGFICFLMLIVTAIITKKL